MTFEKMVDKKYIHKLECKQCSKHYERTSGNKKNLNPGWCSISCRKLWHSLSRRKSNCIECGALYNQTNEKRLFCSKECYYTHVETNPDKYELKQKAKKARTGYTEVSIHRMKETKLKNGTMIDWKDADWKQYWKKCDAITGRMRKKLLECWDGKDYITGEYILNNLQLPYSHGDYPTLDHVIPRSECYKQGLSPYEACSASNLKWTTRKNNSKKGNKVGKTK
jgi:endogenous inhibitor of DNA gyrase (YacG/DUF329 family)